MATQRSCDICRFYRQHADGTPDVIRYTLRREVDQTRENGQRRNRGQMGGGGIDICGECHARICAPRMNPAKAHGRKP